MTDLRRVFFENIEKLAEVDDKIILIVGDLGFSFYEKYAEKYPKQFLNAGCIEGAMIGIAAGMARAGLKPYVYSNSIFLLSRANEQIRDDVAYNNLNVKFIGTGANGFLGFSHNFYFEKPENFIKGFPNIVFVEAKNKERLEIALKLDSPLFIQI